MRQIWRDTKAVSNVIVIVLSLVILTVVVANVVLWSYQMNQLDWERIQENISIASVVPAFNSSWFIVESEYNVNIGSLTSGTYIDTQAIDASYERFAEGLNWWNTNYSYRRRITITNNAASTLGSGYSTLLTMDTVSPVSSGKMLQNGNDLRIIYRNDSSWIEVDRDVIDMNTTLTQVWFKTQVDIPTLESVNDYYVYYGNPDAESPPANKRNVYLWFDDFNRADNPDITTEASYNIKTGGGTWSIENSQLKNVGAAGDPNKLIITALGNVSADIDMFVRIDVTSFAGGDLSRMGLSSCMDSSPSRGSGYCALFHDDTNSLDLLNDLRSWGTRGTYAWSLNTWYLMRFRVIDSASKLGKIKVWPVGATEPATWTVEGNFGSGVARSYGEVGFAGSRTTDTTYFDDIIIRYIIDPEPSTSLSTEESHNNRLDVSGYFVIDTLTYPLSYIQTVEIGLKFRASDVGEKWHLEAYNWTRTSYSDNGFNSTEGYTPSTGWDYYAVNLTNQWSSYVHSNGTVRVRFVDEEVDNNQTTIDIDFLAMRVAIDGATFYFENNGALTSHIVSLWVNNSTYHRRYNVNIFVNAGESIQYIRSDIRLPNVPYIVRVVSERGNIAVYSES